MSRMSPTINNTPLDHAKAEYQKSFTTVIIIAAIKSIKVIYAASEDLRRNEVTFREFNNNIVILSDNDIPDRFEFEGHPTFTLRHLQQCIDQLLLFHTDNENDILPDAINNIVAQTHPTIAQQLQYWRMNLLHLIVYFPQVLANDIHEAILSITSLDSTNIFFEYQQTNSLLINKRSLIQPSKRFISF